MKFTLRTVALLLLLNIAPHVYASPIAVESGTQLGGINGIDIGGTLYNVEFKEGSVFDIFGSTPVFDFNISSAGLASTALLNTYHSLPNTSYDTDPTTTSGCSNIYLCNILTPYTISYLTEEYIFSSQYENRVTSLGDDRVFNVGIPSTYNTETTSASHVSYVWADWSVASVPEPESVVIFLLGLIGLGVCRKNNHNSMT